MASKNIMNVGYCIFVDTLIEGPRPVERDGQGNPFVYPTLLKAQRVIAEDVVERVQQFFNGEREFEDAMTVEEYIVEVNVLPDGSVCDEGGQYYGRE